jgi:outer membrane protein OmpA-like peptidoglycan-associated protein
MTKIQLLGASLVACAGLAAQAPQSENGARMAAGEQPIYRVSVTGRTTKAINYQHRNGATKVDFRGTELMSGSRGEAKVESKQGYIEIEVEFDKLVPATKNGAEYLTYVLWAITPEGRTSNLGEILLNGTKSKLNVTTELQVFALLVTAEPYSAVTRPSDLVVMENVVRPDTIGKIEEVDAKYELLQRGQYQRLANPLALKADKKIPLELYEARNAVSIARTIGAATFATDSFQKAEKSLAAAEAYQARKAGKKPVIMTSREAVQTAEDARAIAVKRQEELALSVERQSALDRENRAESARVAAQAETDRVSREAELARVKAQAEAERLTNEKNAQAAASATAAEQARLASAAATAKANAEADRLRMENEARANTAKAEADRLRMENDSIANTAKAEADRLRMESDARAIAAKAEADRLQRESDTQRAASQAALDAAAKQVAELETQKSALRGQLLAQFNAILQTQDTARGLIVNMSDVLFDTAKSTLRPLAREKLAKVAGIVSGHPGLRLEVEGHTDSVGSDEYNQKLSEERGGAVRDYLTGQGMADGSVTSKGLGENQPVATNDSAKGRQQNRRVELVISGEVIGTRIGVSGASQ